MARQAVKPKTKAKSAAPARTRPAKAPAKVAKKATAKPSATKTRAKGAGARVAAAAPKAGTKDSASAKDKKAAKPAATTGRRKKVQEEKPAPPVRMRPPWTPPKPPPPRKPAKRVNFDAKALAAIKKGLEEQREELAAQLKDIEEQAFNASQSEMSGEVGYDEDYADAGTATFERERDLSLANNVQDLLDKINKALSKIDDGTYGVCESCGEPISGERLKALPHVLMCIRCKTQEERR